MSREGRPKIVVLGTMCHQPLAGMAALFLQYLIGLKRLGFQPYYIEWHGRWVPDPEDGSKDAQFPRVIVADLLRRHGLVDHWICRADQIGEGRTFGPLQRDRLKRVYREAVALINVTGAHRLTEEQLACDCRIYLETDPGLPQARLRQNDASMRSLVDAHTHHFTWAQNLGGSDCLLPATHLKYRLTRQPIVLDLWECNRPVGERFTTLSKWEKRGKDLAIADETYLWSKHHQFLRFIDLPRHTPQPLELALSGCSASDRRQLLAHGWSVRDAWAISGNFNAYRDYIADSRGEFTIAKDQYVRLRTGWFSDRSACYLASGRPVVTQETRFDASLPTGEGLFKFDSVNQAAAALEAISSDPLRHARAAREIAREYFDAERVLARLLSDAGVEVPTRRSAMRQHSHVCYEPATIDTAAG